MESKEFVRSLSDCDCTYIKDYLDRTIKRALPVYAENGTYEQETGGMVTANVEFYLLAFEDMDDQFDLEELTIEISDEELPLEHGFGQIYSDAHNGDHDRDITLYRGLFKIDWGTKFARVTAVGYFSDWVEREQDYQEILNEGEIEN